MLASSHARALEPIDTDGPDFVESSEAVGKGRLQVEANYAMDGGRDRRVTTTTPTLVRLGVAPTLELRFETEGAQHALGMKWHSQDRDADAGIPSVSWIFHVENGGRPSLRAVATWELPYDLALGVMPGIKVEERHAIGIFGAALNRRWTARFRTFVEAAAPQIGNGGTPLSWALGAAYLVTNDWQLGARAAWPLTQSAPTGQLLFELAGRF